MAFCENLYGFKANLDNWRMAKETKISCFTGYYQKTTDYIGDKAYGMGVL